MEWLLIKEEVYQPEAVFGDDPLFKKFEIYIFVADAFSYNNRRYLEDVLCFYGQYLSKPFGKVHQ